MAKFIKKPVIIDAEQWLGDNINDIFSLSDDVDKMDLDGEILIIHTLEGDMRANPTDYIIKGVHGELYPCKEDIFMETYDLCGNVF